MGDSSGQSFLSLIQQRVVGAALQSSPSRWPLVRREATKSLLITPHCVVHYASLTVDTAHSVLTVDSNRIIELRHNRLKGLDEWIRLLLGILALNQDIKPVLCCIRVVIYIFSLAHLIPELLLTFSLAT